MDSQNPIDRYRKNQERIARGEYRWNDMAYIQCQCCFPSSYIPHCTYLFINGKRLWTCGFCERQINKRRKDVTYKIAIDADSIVSKSLHRQPDNIELAFYEFCSEIGSIKGAIFNGLHEYEKGDDIEMKIVLTPRRNFRYDIYPDYKHKRQPRSEERIALMKLIMQRLKPWAEIHANVEADDVVIYYAKQGWLVAAIDKDVINACPTYCYNYNKYKWEPPSNEMAINGWYLMQALMGDTTDCIPGAKGIGEKKAFQIVDDMNWKSFSNIIQYFDSYEDALLSMRLVRMDQWNGKEVILWEPDFEGEVI